MSDDLSMCNARWQDKDKTAAVTASDQPAQNKNQEQKNCSAAKDQPSQDTNEEDQEDSSEFVFAADGIPDSNEASSDSADIQLQLEWMSVTSYSLSFYVILVICFV